jgi:hypothetical protein
VLGLELFVQCGERSVAGVRFREVVDVVYADPERDESILLVEKGRDCGVAVGDELVDLLLEGDGVVVVEGCSGVRISDDCTFEQPGQESGISK